MTTLTIKQGTLYGAYAPEFDVSAWGNCQDEALNNLTDQLREQNAVGELTGDEKNSYAIR